MTTPVPVPLGLAIIVAFVLVAVFAPRRDFEVRSRGFQLFRALFPSWRFFDEVGEMPVLSHRTGPSKEELGPWVDSLEPARREVGTVFLNARGNFLFACHSLLQQLVNDLEDLEEQPENFEESVSYRLVQQLAVHQIVSRASAPSRFWYQFKVTSMPPSGATGEEVLRSAVYEQGGVL